MKVPLRVALVLFTATVLQRGLFSELRIANVAADIFLLLAITAGLTGGADRGALLGFLAGLCFDLLVQTPLGLSALVYCLIGYLAGRAEGSVVRSSRWLPVAFTVGGSALGVVLFAVFGAVLGQHNTLNAHLLAVVAVVSIVNGLLAVPALAVSRWMWATEPGLRPALR